MKDTNHLEITPKLIDFGSSVIQLSHVTRAGIWVQHPLRPAGAALLLVAAGLFGREIFLQGGKLALPETGSVALWAACGAAALGIFMLAYARRSLLIATSDGARLLLPAGDAQFARAFTACIRDAIAAGPDAQTTYEIDIPSRSITPLPLDDALHAPLGIPVDSAHESSLVRALATSVSSGPMATAGVSQGTNGARAPLAAPMITRHSDPVGAGLRSPEIDRDLSRRLDPQPARTTATNGATPLATGKPADLTSRLATSIPASRPIARGDGLRDLTALMSFVNRSEIQHKKALLDLLRVVEDHEKGGAVSREDAEAHWRSFADYVQQYLGAVDELPDLTRRAGRGLGVPERSARL